MPKAEAAACSRRRRSPAALPAPEAPAEPSKRQAAGAQGPARERGPAKPLTATRAAAATRKEGRCRPRQPKAIIKRAKKIVKEASRGGGTEAPASDEEKKE